MSAKSQHTNILYAILGFAAAVIIVALIGFFALYHVKVLRLLVGCCGSLTASFKDAVKFLLFHHASGIKEAFGITLLGEFKEVHSLCRLVSNRFVFRFVAAGAHHECSDCKD